METTNFEIGHTFTQHTEIEEYGFFFPEVKFTIVEVKEKFIQAVGHGAQGIKMGIEKDKFDEYFEMTFEIDPFLESYNDDPCDDYDSDFYDSTNSKKSKDSEMKNKHVEEFVERASELKKDFSTDFVIIEEEKFKRIISKNVITLITEMEDGEKVKGRAKCSPTDNFNLHKGTSIAYHRLNIKLLSATVKRINEYLNDEIKELERLTK